MNNQATPFVAASIQFNPLLNHLNENLEELYKPVKQASERGAKLIVTPEMATTGYHYQDRKSIQPFVDSIPGKTTKLFEKIARQFNNYIVIGMAEVDEENGLYYNSAALVGPNGYIGKYRKIHQWADEENWSVWGDHGIPVFDTDIGKLAIIICMDSCYFEPARIAAVNGADILCFPTNSTGQSLSLLQGLAETNGMFVIGANRSNTECGYHMVGASVIWSPNGEKLAETDYILETEPKNEADILYAVIDPRQYENKAKDRIKYRRHELYHDLMLYKGPWDSSQKVEYTAKNDKNTYMQTALLQYEPEIGDKLKNFQKVTSLLKDSVQNSTDKAGLILVVCPELSLTGQVDSLHVSSIQMLAETMDGQTVTQMKQLASRHHVFLVFGMIERDEENLYNSVILLNPSGEVVAKARKTHLTDFEKRWAKAGEEIVVNNIEGLGRIGLMIGSEAAYPEIAGVLAVKQVDLIILPSSWKGEFGQHLMLHPKMMENRYPENSMTTWDSISRFAQANTLVANYVGTKRQYKGSSGLYTIDPIYGSEYPVIASSDKEEALIVKIPYINKEWWFTQRKLLLTRRTFFYKSLIQKISTL